MRIGAVILAGGLSTRMGNNKLLLPLGSKTVLEHVIDTVSLVEFDQVVLVLGHEAEVVKTRLNNDNLLTVINKHYHQGQSTSVKAGLSRIRSECDAVIFMMGDQPLVDEVTLNKMLSVFMNSEKSILVPNCKGKQGSPVIFSNKWFDELDQVSGDMGGRHIIRSNPDDVFTFKVEDEKFFYDVDTEVMYKKVLEFFD
jgi:molybdenum cofactor cytidylyltransferase